MQNQEIGAGCEVTSFRPVFYTHKMTKQKQKTVTIEECNKLNQDWSLKCQEINHEWDRTCEKIIKDNMHDILIRLIGYLLMNTLWAIILLQVI